MQIKLSGLEIAVKEGADWHLQDQLGNRYADVPASSILHATLNQLAAYKEFFETSCALELISVETSRTQVKENLALIKSQIFHIGK